MKTKLIVLTLALSSTLLSCSSTRQEPPPPPPPGQAEIRADYLQPEDTRRVRTGELVKTYHLGRSTGGGNGRFMHEAHRVYRVERPNRWNLARDQPPLASTGPVNKIVDPAFRPAPESQAVRAELNRQKEITGDLEEARGELVGTLVSARARLLGTIGDLEDATRLRVEADRPRTENQVQEDSPIAAEEPATSTDALRQWGEKIGRDKPTPDE